MSSSPKAIAAAAIALAAGAALAQSTAFHGIGRPATAKEVAAWDIDVRPDFKGLPKGSGSVAQGMEVWEAKRASCHGIFGESNEVFTPLVGGTTKEDVKTGRAARLTDPAYPGRTTLMKVATISTLWDYIRRAMPWNAPKSLATDEVYAVTAFLLNLGGVLPDDYVLSDRNIAQAKKLLPNRYGMTAQHGMWPGRSLGNGGKPDVKAVACMKDCAAEPSVASFLPDFARNAHGNLAEQNRPVGAQRGADTTAPASTSAVAGDGSAADHQDAATAPVPDLSWHRRQGRRPGAAGRGEEVRGTSRRRRVPDAEDPRRGCRHLGTDPDAAAGPAGSRRHGHREVAGRRRQALTTHKK